MSELSSAYADRVTDRELEALEKRIAKTYSSAAKDMESKAAEYFKAFEVRDAKELARLADGKITEAQYKQWRLNQIARGKRYEAMRDALAKRAAEAARVAAAYVNDVTPGLYSLNYNYTAYTVERVAGNVGFTTFDEQTVRRLIADNPRLLPVASVDIPKEILWDARQINAQITAGILQGEPTAQIVERLQQVTDMGRDAAIRNARTAVTGAQNAGRQDSMERATAMGLEFRKRWIGTKDSRTRPAHGLADGQTVPVDEYFEVGGENMLHPGDMTASPKNLYNCRCSMRTVYDGEDTAARQMRVRDPLTGKNVVVSAMTYTEWQRWASERGG